MIEDESSSHAVINVTWKYLSICGNYTRHISINGDNQYAEEGHMIRLDVSKQTLSGVIKISAISTGYDNDIFYTLIGS